jgi:hypothetical protein
MNMRTLVCIIATIHLEYKNDEGEIIKKNISKVNEKFECPEDIAKHLVKSRVAMDITNGIPEEVGVNQAGVLRKELDITLVDLNMAKENIEKLASLNTDLADRVQDLERKNLELTTANQMLTNQNEILTNQATDNEKKAKK